MLLCTDGIYIILYNIVLYYIILYYIILYNCYCTTGWLCQNPIEARMGSGGPRKIRFSEFLDNQHMTVAKLPGLSTGRLNLPGDTHGTHFCQRLSRPSGHSAAGGINCPIGNRTRDHPACSLVHQQTEPPRTQKSKFTMHISIAFNH